MNVHELDQAHYLIAWGHRDWGDGQVVNIVFDLFIYLLPDFLSQFFFFFCKPACVFMLLFRSYVVLNELKLHIVKQTSYSAISLSTNTNSPQPQLK